MMRVLTCYKNPESPSCINLILRNKIRNLQNVCLTKTVLSDSHKLRVTTLKMQFRKLKLRALF